MYVCICNRVTDRQLRQAMQQGAHSLAALQRELELGTGCGSCLSTAQQLLSDNLQQQLAQRPDIYYAA